MSRIDLSGLRGWGRSAPDTKVKESETTYQPHKFGPCPELLPCHWAARKQDDPLQYPDQRDKGQDDTDYSQCPPHGSHRASRHYCNVVLILELWCWVCDPTWDAASLRFR